MPDDAAPILRYLQPARGSFWRWDDDGRSLTWTGGETIAFREELLAVLKRLADTNGPGLPPFAAVVLLLAATRDSWPANGPRIVTHARRLLESGGGETASAVGVMLRAVGHRLETDATTVAAMGEIATLPADLRRPLAAKATIAEVVFEGTAWPLLPSAAAVIAELESGTNPTTFDRPATDFALRELVDTIDALRPGLARLDADQLANRLRTGLDGSVRPAEIELGPADRARQLLTDPFEDPDLSAITRLARGLLAAVAVPRPVGAPDDRPAGGVSDLSNRGPLDRLLLSELAHDELTLAVRVAVNEALYMQREIPPREPPRSRAILVDTGLRTWGVPRIYVTAVALALVATSDPDGDVAAHRPAVGPGLAPADLTTGKGLLDHLSALDGRAHFGDALPAFAQLAGDATEPFLVTHADVLDDADFQRALRDHPPAYAAAVDRDGSFKLWHLSPAGRRLVRAAKLDLDALLEPPEKPAVAKPTPLLKPSGDLPVILSTRPFPLRIPPQQPLRRCERDGVVALAITADRQLVAEEMAISRAPLLLGHIPWGRVDLLGQWDEETVVAVITDAPGADSRVRCSRVVARLDGSSARVDPLDLPFRPDFVYAHAGIIYLIAKGRAAAVGLESTEPLAVIPTGECKWVRGRIFAAGGRAYVLAYDGSALLLEAAPANNVGARNLFESSRLRGLLQIDRQGRITRLDGNDTELVAGLGESVHIEHINPHGSRFVIVRTYARPAEQKRYVVDLDANTGWTPIAHGEVPPVIHVDQMPPAEWFWRPLRHRFTHVYVDPSGTLALVDRHGTAWEVVMSGRNVRLGKVPPLLVPANRSMPFGPADRPDGVGYRLRGVKWPNGSRAFLDSRGLLHLKSIDRTVPEVTIVLAADGPLAGWSSDDRVYGQPYFHGRATSHGLTHLEDLIRRFTDPLR